MGYKERTEQTNEAALGELLGMFGDGKIGGTPHVG